MITVPDFSKKQILIVLFKDGEKLSFNNDNLAVRDSEGKIKFQVTCYRLFLVIGIGYCSITSALIQRANRFGFGIALFSQSFKLYTYIGLLKDGNTLLRQKQYEYKDLEIAKLIVQNKMSTQYRTLQKQRNKTETVLNAMDLIENYFEKISHVVDLHSLLAYEGLASKAYFQNHFNNIQWKGRRPRVKEDIINSCLDIGYTILFAFIDALLMSFGFDTYCGVYHRQFYMRKSLVCDLVEPFRCIIDYEVKKAYNLKQIQEEDFEVINHQYRLKWAKNGAYVSLFVKAILEEKAEIFKYIQMYYRCFMRGDDITNYPFFKGGITEIGNHKL